MKLLIFSERGKIDPLLWKQTAEGVRLSMGVWGGKQHDQTDLSELVRAILMDEPIKMRRLGDLYHIDVEALSDMWILKSQTTQKLSRWVKQIRELSGHYADISLCEPYESDILIFPVGKRTLREMDAWAEALARFCRGKTERRQRSPAAPCCGRPPMQNLPMSSITPAWRMPYGCFPAGLFSCFPK